METTPRSRGFSAGLDPWLARLFADGEPTAVGSGWPGGVVAVLAGLLGLGGVLCLRFPATLTAPSLRVIYPLAVVRVAIGALLVLAFALGAASALVRRRKVLGATAIALATAALAMGGPRAAVPAAIGRGAGIGLDWFLLNALIMTAVFVPLERLAPHDPSQRVFRRGWATDAVYTFIGHASIQVVSALVVIPGQLLRVRVFGAAAPTLGRLPLWAQLPLVLVVADLAFYWIHRAAHRVPAFWRLHRLHHSGARMDWLASERLHLAEIVIVRAGVLVPLTLLGFSQTAILAYVTFASFHAVFIHANFGPSLRWLEPVLMTPRLHHLHHAVDADAIDTNFAVHLPILDRLFGTLFAPEGRWPSRTGVVGFRAPDGFWSQQASVFAPALKRGLVFVLVAASALTLLSAPARAEGAPDTVRKRQTFWPCWEIDGAVITTAETSESPQVLDQLVPVLATAHARHAAGYDRLRAALCTDDDDEPMCPDRARACSTLPADLEVGWRRTDRTEQWVVRGVATAAYAGAITAAAVERNREAGREIATVAGIPDGVCLGAIAAGIVMIPIVGADDAKKGSPAVRHTIGAVVWVAGLVAGGVVGARVAHSLAASPDARVPVTAVGLASTYLTTLVMTLDW